MYFYGYVLSTAESNMSGRTIATPNQPSVKLVSDDEEDSPLISSSLTSGDEENPITPTTPEPQDMQVRPVPTQTQCMLLHVQVSSLEECYMY